jgi:pimeloyl-ACP methyl ester carboxylesterase
MTFRWPLASTFLVLAIATACASPVVAQRFRSARPEASKLDTQDGVKLSLTYYPSSEEKDATPVILLHDYKDTQGMFTSLAARLQTPGRDDKHKSFAVVTVDLRGHGASTQQTLPNGASGTIDAAKLEKNDFIAMSVYDMEAVRSFLVGENDEHHLNLNKLCLVGVGMGATVAVNWAARDWVAPPLLIGKQGQDVKALVLVSPRWKYRGVLMQQAMKVRPLKQNAAWMLIWGGEDSDAATDARRISKQLERYHPEPKSSQAARPRSFQQIPLRTTLQGSNLLSQAGKPLEDRMVEFLVQQVADQELPWIQRRNRLD